MLWSIPGVRNVRVQIAGHSEPTVPKNNLGKSSLRTFRHTRYLPLNSARVHAAPRSRIIRSHGYTCQDHYTAGTGLAANTIAALERNMKQIMSTN